MSVCQIRYFNSLPVARSFFVEHLTDRYESLVNEWYENLTGGKHEKAHEKKYSSIKTVVQK